MDYRAYTNTEYLLKRILDALKNPAAASMGYVGDTFDDSPAIPLPSIPDQAVSAIIAIEGDAAAADPDKLARFREDGIDPDTSTGRPVGDRFIYEIIGKANIDNFRIIGITVGETHTIHVEYYGK